MWKNRTIYAFQVATQYENTLCGWRMSVEFVAIIIMHKFRLQAHFVPNLSFYEMPTTTTYPSPMPNTCSQIPENVSNMFRICGILTTAHTIFRDTLEVKLQFVATAGDSFITAKTLEKLMKPKRCHVHHSHWINLRNNTWIWPWNMPCKTAWMWKPAGWRTHHKMHLRNRLLQSLQRIRYYVYNV